MAEEQICRERDGLPDDARSGKLLWGRPVMSTLAALNAEASIANYGPDAGLFS